MQISALKSKILTMSRLIKNPKKLIYPFSQNGFFKWIPDQTFLRLLYWAELDRKLDLDNPILFSEKIQWLKIHDRNPEYCKLVDKFLMKRIVEDRIGRQYVIPLLGVWKKPEDINFDNLPNSFVLKCNHDSGGVVICRNKAQMDRRATIQKLRVHYNRNAYTPSREWPYKNIDRVIFAEKLIDDGTGNDLIDYKIYCFNGEPKYCQVIKNRRITETIDFYDTNWKLQPFNGLGVGSGFPHGTYTAKPDNYETMLSIARTFAVGTKFVRIDLYNVEGKIYFGEFTLYPKSGFGVFLPDEWNEIIGNMLDL